MYATGRCWLTVCLFIFAAHFLGTRAETAEPDFATLDRQYATRIQPLIQQMCADCHSTDKREGELDLQRFASLSQVRADSAVWPKVIEMLDTHEMPPRDAPQLDDNQLKEFRTWLDEYVVAEGAASAGDPGPVVLRRLNNVEYTNSIQALTGQPLQPAREFPADSAAGEGFTNTGNALVMSPALLDKYIAAAKFVSEHALLLPDGIRFSSHTTRRDWTDDVLRRLREFYGRSTDASGSTRVDLQGIQWETNAGGRLPLAPYMLALLEARADLLADKRTTAQVAEQSGLNAKYTRILWETLQRPDASALIKQVQTQFANVDTKTLPALLEDIGRWQEALTRFQSVGHMKPWLAAVTPFVDQKDLRIVLTVSPGQKDVAIALAAGDAGDGNTSDFVVWSQPRLVAPGRADLYLSDLAAIDSALKPNRQQLFDTTQAALLAASQFMAADVGAELEPLARQHNIDSELLAIWFDYLAISTSGPVKIEKLFTEPLRSASGYAFVNGWGSAETPNIMASSGDALVRIPGNLKPHGVVVHPAPTVNAAVGWRSPFTGMVRIDGVVTHAHPECGNGVSWAVELRRGASRERLAAGIAHGGQPVTFGPLQSVRVAQGELISLLIGPRDGNHACDLTDIDFRITEETAEGNPRSWNLSEEVSPDILSGNPHADKHGHKDTWNFYTESISAADANRAVVPNGSLLKNWFAATDELVRGQLAEQCAVLLTGARPVQDGPDQLLWDQTHDFNGPLLGPLLDLLAKKARSGELPRVDEPAIVVAGGPEFGEKTGPGSEIDAMSLAVQAPGVVRLLLPSDVCRSREFVVTGKIDSLAGPEACVQLQAYIEPAAEIQKATGGLTAPSLTSSLPLVARADSAARVRFERAADDFRQVFPAALCYVKIVPVDEVVTLELFHREDENLQRLMLSTADVVELDRLWEELHFVSQDLLTIEDAYEQLMQFATQDSDPRLFEHLREPIAQRAQEFRDSLLAAEPKHVAAVAELAATAFRRPLTETERTGLTRLYDQLRTEGLGHEAATRLLLVRILVSTSFLYRIEHSQPGTASSPVNDSELAVRLSYFLWSSPPDAHLREIASTGKLTDPEQLIVETRRMLSDARVEQLSREFACHWLHIQDVAELNEKSERHFPEFAALRGDLQREAEMFFTDLFQHDGSVLNVFDADHTFVNARLAKHYGIESLIAKDLPEDTWQRVEGVRQAGRGGVLTFGATLATQSGASRTSPILRGNWISEVLLGERLPRPPKDVPPLPEGESSENWTVRQLVERHTQDERCASCHLRIDSFGFAMENYDAIGAFRSKDLTGQPLDTSVTLPDGSPVTGAEQLRAYLVDQKRSVLIKQFCKKLLGYALGRSIQLSDNTLLAEMQMGLKENDYRISAAVEPIVRSRQFLHIRDQNAVANE